MGHASDDENLAQTGQAARAGVISGLRRVCPRGCPRSDDRSPPGYPSAACGQSLPWRTATVDPPGTRIVPLLFPLTAAAPHGTGHRRSSQENAAQRSPSRLRREDGPVRRLGHAGRVLGHRRRAHGGARARRRCSTSATWARSRSPARTRSPRSSASRATTPSKLQVGQAQYSGLLTPQGTFVDDLLVYRLAPQHFLLVVNASHIAEGLRVHRRAHQAGRRRRGRRRQLALRADRACRARGRSTSCSRSPASIWRR